MGSRLTIDGACQACGWVGPVNELPRHVEAAHPGADPVDVEGLTFAALHGLASAELSGAARIALGWLLIASTPAPMPPIHTLDRSGIPCKCGWHTNVGGPHACPLVGDEAREVHVDRVIMMFCIAAGLEPLGLAELFDVDEVDA